MSFIFISYSRQDQAYVSTLVQALQSHRLPVWIDDRIDYGSTWPRVIQDHLEQCAVFVVVMSPRSQDSHWVQCELSLALELKKPIFPLLLEGRRWLSVAAIQSVDVMGGKLPPARFLDTMRKYFPVTITTAESPLRKTVVNTLSPIASTRTDIQITPANYGIKLKSAKGVDYTMLQNLLKVGRWREADQETGRRMLEAVGREANDWILSEELRNFPCADLQTIDQLWVKYSDGRFGFSVQQRIWEDCGSPIQSGKNWYQFCTKIGWKQETASRFG